MQPYVITIASEKGGVGKTTLATNLAIYLKALREDLPVTLFSFDNHFSVDQMFRLGSLQPSGTVYDLLLGRPLKQLLTTGQFGVQYVASSLKLAELRDKMADPAHLASCLAEAELDGILIIDTRPDLDEFTANALFAADRVIIPVKDTPSLENTRRIYRFFEHHGLSKQTLRVLPCLIDSRIRYSSGPFETPYQLLKAYALNRGYRLMEGYIAKSPKVESLNTNPEGCIYPVLTHGRSTEVHLQLAHLARQLVLDAQDCTEHRLETWKRHRDQTLQTRRQQHRDRIEQLSWACLACGRPLPTAGLDAFYLEGDRGRPAGFVESSCLTDMVFGSVYRKTAPDRDPGLTDIFLESALRGYFAVVEDSEKKLRFCRLDEEGRILSSKPLAPERSLFHRPRSGLIPFWQKLAPDNFLLLRRGQPGRAEELLTHQAYSGFCRIRELFSAQLTGA
ncbi:MAG: ParA family protein [Deltaproteobacteria bacterium]|nr:MAG: ParA family protein [Deltaproteobacteria bacterium]